MLKKWIIPLGLVLLFSSIISTYALGPVIVNSIRVHTFSINEIYYGVFIFGIMGLIGSMFVNGWYLKKLYEVNPKYPKFYVIALGTLILSLILLFVWAAIQPGVSM